MWPYTELAAEQIRMVRRKPRDIGAKLQRANELAAQGKMQREIAADLGVSVMTLHRWRKRAAADRPTSNPSDIARENALLRRLITDVLLENVRLKDELAETARIKPKR
jgi:transposase